MTARPAETISRNERLPLPPKVWAWILYLFESNATGTIEIHVKEGRVIGKRLVPHIDRDVN